MEHATITELDPVEVDDEGCHKTIRNFALHLRSTTIHLSSLGASIIKFMSKNDSVSKINEVDIIAGYKDVKTMYETDNPVYFSAIVGRVANRIANGKFSIDSNSYQLDINNPPNSLHGGKVGFSHKIWNAKIKNDNTVEFSLTSLDGDQGFPGSIHVTATYTLRPSFSASGVVLQLRIHAQLLKGSIPTPINLSNHSYFNLGDVKDGILEHSLKVESDAYTPVDENLIPTRTVKLLNEDPVMDFCQSKKLREALERYGTESMGLSSTVSKQNIEARMAVASNPYGFDHNYVVRKQPGLSIPRIASLAYKSTNLTIYSNAPGVQVYTGNYLGPNENDTVCKAKYGPWSAICLETQHFPDSITTNTTSTPSADTNSFWSGKCPILTEKEANYDQTILYRLETDSPDALLAYYGSDSEGNVYKSIEEMWKAQDLSSWYHRAKDWYEENCDTTIDGVLGGIGHISNIDLEGSREFLKQLKLPPFSKDQPSLACECGAGIGRVTKGLLLNFFDCCDLVESSPRLLNAAPDHIGIKSSQCRFFCSELQDWHSGIKKYSVVWIQWVLCYLTDKDIVDFLIRSSESLVDGGWIILKENTSAEEAFHVDVDDASITRCLQYWLDLIAKSGLQVKHLIWQENFPDDIYPVPMIALQR